MPDQEHIVEELEELIRISHDGEQGYREAAEHVKDPNLKQLLNEVSLQRTKFAHDLEKEAARWGRAAVERTGTAFGTFHRAWTDLKAGLGGGDDAILGSMESGDDYARKRYDDAIRDSETPPDVVGILRNQAQAIVGTLDRIRALRRRRAA